MSQEQEYEEAVEIVARQLCGADDDQWRYLTERRHVLEPWILAARAILSLTWPSGQPVIGVLSKNQRLPHLISVSVTHNEVTFWKAGQEAMVDDGFRRVVEKR